MTKRQKHHLLFMHATPTTRKIHRFLCLPHTLSSIKIWQENGFDFLSNSMSLSSPTSIVTKIFHSFLAYHFQIKIVRILRNISLQYSIKP
ncbi:hypothetical protein HanRHA438_Chr01g0021681 [Helianthus annuus]|nr:hypothetical protein HanRHA438_Chr01g0021681 [Helianthus annuus]